jgi:hypothetical protein
VDKSLELKPKSTTRLSLQHGFHYNRDLIETGFRIQDSGFRIQDSGFRIQDSGFRIQDSGFRIQDSG